MVTGGICHGVMAVVKRNSYQSTNRTPTVQQTMILPWTPVPKHVRSSKPEVASRHTFKYLRDLQEQFPYTWQHLLPCAVRNYSMSRHAYWALGVHMYVPPGGQSKAALNSVYLNVVYTPPLFRRTGQLTHKYMLSIYIYIRVSIWRSISTPTSATPKYWICILYWNHLQVNASALLVRP